MEDGPISRAQYKSMGQSASPQAASARTWSPPWTRAEDNRLRELQQKQQAMGKEGMPPIEVSELRHLERRNTRFIEAGLKSMQCAPASKPATNHNGGGREEQLAYATRRLCWDMSNALLTRGRENAVVWPLGVFAALTVLAAATEGDAQQELKARVGALRLGGLQNAVNTAAELLRQLNEKPESLKIEVDLKMPQEKSPAVDFERLEAACGQLKLVACSAAVHNSPLGAAVCTTTLRLAWQLPFPLELTAEAPFHSPDFPAPVPVDLMHCRAAFPYAEKEGRYSCVAMGLADGVEALVVLPAKGQQVGDVLQGAEGLWDDLKRTEGDVWMPRCDVSGCRELREELSGACGAEAVFRDVLSSLRGGSPSCCVAEAGVADASASPPTPAPPAASLSALPLGSRKRFKMRCDRPFLFLLRHHTGCVLLCAVVTSPVPVKQPVRKRAETQIVSAFPFVDKDEQLPVSRKRSDTAAQPSAFPFVRNELDDLFSPEPAAASVPASSTVPPRDAADLMKIFDESSAASTPQQQHPQQQQPSPSSIESNLRKQAELRAQLAFLEKQIEMASPQQQQNQSTPTGVPVSPPHIPPLSSPAAASDSDAFGSLWDSIRSSG